MNLGIIKASFERSLKGLALTVELPYIANNKFSAYFNLYVGGRKGLPRLRWRNIAFNRSVRPSCTEARNSLSRGRQMHLDYQAGRDPFGSLSAYLKSIPGFQVKEWSPGFVNYYTE